VTEGDNADYTNWEAVAVALARHITNRNGDRRDRRMAMRYRVPRNLQDHWPNASLARRRRASSHFNSF